ncbi:hypothetical protein QTG54_010390 [Skeletonema marinoi]|uniref:Uncharacterized protein n=2 Tax=Skeletonema marinoi TaxID=267567 RepID=A0AAD8Y3P7_9STRA|nr:hypothetical protein QTG54_010390 [Skeletonema marinoi]|mmetsp:Transcript_13238/g.22576  ORF Transcript_13238/g.22576 Transcript_13238/m.22576 type:complete len:228 (+) Transcript_13238:57-740(+)
MKRLLCPDLLLCWLLLFVERVDSFCPSSAISKPPALRRVAQSPTGLLVTPPQDSSPIKFSTTKLYSSTAFSLSSSDIENDAQSTRSKLRQITGFSLTAFRATVRGITGISLSGVISNTIRRILGILRPGFRWILQPLLIVYYVPILIVRYYVIGPSQQYVEDSRKGHEKLVDGWRKAVEAAEKAHADGYWPVHLNDDGNIIAQLPPDPADVFDVTDGIERSVAENLS